MAFKFGQISNMIKVLELAAKESRGHLNKTIQAELDEGMKDLVQAVTDALSESIENMTDEQAQHCDDELESIYKSIK